MEKLLAAINGQVISAQVAAFHADQILRGQESRRAAKVMSDPRSTKEEIKRAMEEAAR